MKRSDMTTPSVPQLLNSRQAAEVLGISERKLWDMANRRGDIPCVRLDRSVRYDPRDLDEFIQRSKPPSEATSA